MRLLNRPVRPKPAYFGPDGAPPGVALRLDVYTTLNDGTKWLASRPTIRPNTIVGHTNGASVEATVQSSINYGLAGTNNTKPHYCLGDKPAKTLRSDLRGIANSTGATIEAQFGVQDSSFWSIAVETADIGSLDAAATGVNWPHDCGPFLYDNADDFAHIIAYESIVHGFPIRFPPSFPAGGVVPHTSPEYPYPYFTTVPGKTCPGETKRRAILDEIIPRAAQIRAAWTATTEPTDPEDDAMLVIRVDGYADQFMCVPIDNPDARRKMGIPDTQPPVVVQANRAEIEAQLPYKLAPFG